MTHRKWSFGSAPAAEVSLKELEREHGELYDEWKASEHRVMETLDENNRLDRELDEARERIAELEDRPEANIRWSCSQMDFARHLFGMDAQSGVGANCNYERAGRAMDYLAKHALVPTTRVPFSDAQIERMAEAARNGFYGPATHCDWHECGLQDDWRQGIRAALAAGGVEPCAVPEYDPDDVAHSTPIIADLHKQLEAARREVDEVRRHISVTMSREHQARKEAQEAKQQADEYLRMYENEQKNTEHWKAKAAMADADLRGRASVPVPAGVPSVEELVAVGDKAYNACSGPYQEAQESRATAIRDAVLAGVAAETASVAATDDQVEALARVLYEAWGWELDVTAELAASMLQDMKASYCEKTSYSTWDQLGENYKEDFIKVFERFLPSLASRIKPVYECKECDRLKDIVSVRLDRVRAALEGE